MDEEDLPLKTDCRRNEKKMQGLELWNFKPNKDGGLVKRAV